MINGNTNTFKDKLSVLITKMSTMQRRRLSLLQCVVGSQGQVISDYDLQGGALHPNSRSDLVLPLVCRQGSFLSNELTILYDDPFTQKNVFINLNDIHMDILN